MSNLIVIIVLSYLAGSIPVGLITGKKVANIDIREHGSKSIGATNVKRVLGLKWGILTLLLDASKGAIAVLLIARLYLGNFPFPNETPFDDFTLVQIIAGLAAVVGHIWTIFAGFKGGKGIATALGVLVGIVTIDILVALGVFILVVTISRYISLGSILAAVAVPVTLFLRENVFHVDIQSYGTLLPFLIAIALLAIFTHRKNIGRLLNGEEDKFSFSKKFSNS
ncbi:glycerol-3-phosphate 1-O-acyltransferase PlsY [Candidatus Gracilibacteria bacterium]|nr:glycerol-3-phosphate 1-O-acyltransferase PlsY [Candidatus Gracilibacteria bacterium]MCF7819332.1 glycerol-3-phosphate 1-O-acyltransferase PlsY [Candidatus Gracilibacteria bacterium]